GHDEIVTTQKVRDFVAHKIGVAFDPAGERLLRGSQRPVQAFRVVTATSPSLRPGVRVASVAVLPFGTDGPADAAYLGDAITEEIIASMSLNRALFVIAHGSTLRYRGRGGEPSAIAAELGVRYVVTGSPRRADGK